jgi:hypothetical protein
MDVPVVSVGKREIRSGSTIQPIKNPYLKQAVSSAM